MYKLTLIFLLVGRYLFGQALLSEQVNTNANFTQYDNQLYKQVTFPYQYLTDTNYTAEYSWGN